ncbi:MAG TPA: MOSC domain-containing protein [Candidatus Eremiobacteraceae bacterium]|nr:MOSC domain-containing protein [Candidatus Eremiobacteraceae bacterium]
MRVTHLWRYPFKSMRGEALTAARMELGGMPFDRRFAFRDETPGSNRLGQLETARQHLAMLGYAARVVDGSVVIAAPDGSLLAATDPALAQRVSAETGSQLTVTEDPSGGNHDDADVLVINAASVAKLAAEWGHDVDPRRFRPNVLVAGDRPFQEEAWVGRYMKIGEATLKVVSPCVRCVLTTVEPETLAVDPSFLRLVAQKHNASFGVYAKVVEPGAVRVDDDVAVTEGQSEPDQAQGVKV